LKIDFKTVSMMQLRKSPGEYLDRVANDDDVFVVERDGHARACLVPVSFLLPDISGDCIARELERLRTAGESFKLAITEQKELEIKCHESAGGDSVIISVVLPHGYPGTAPRIYAISLVPSHMPSNTPRRREDGSLLVFGVSSKWDAECHDAVHALVLARRWLKQYEKWRRTGEWPTASGAVS
jgi:hypothetical protein